MNKNDKNELDYSSITAELKHNKLRPFYVIIGAEDFLADNLIKQLTSMIIQPGAEDFDLFKYDGEKSNSQLDLNQLKDQCKTLPFISAKRAFVLRNTDWFNAGGGQINNLIDFFSELDENSCLIFREKKLDKRQKKLVEAINKYGALVNIDVQNKAVLLNWIAAYLQRANISIDVASAEKMLSITDSNMYFLLNENKKLILYCQANQISHINLKIVDLICAPDLEGTIFQLTDYLIAGQLNSALLLLAKLIEQPQPPLLILFMIARSVKQLILAKDYNSASEIQSNLKVPQFVGKKLLQQARLITYKQLISWYELCFQMDSAIKSGNIDAELALELILVEFGKKHID